MFLPVMNRRRWVTLNISIGVYMSTLDASIVNISLPTIIRSLNTHLTAVAWVVLRYEATNRDGGWPSEIGIQVPVSNRLKLLWERNTR